mgnify:CR=1 FL=1|tara:strand:- start:1847 stop:2548 length:702 start_codon:yes stop_codon:yes gene_type:complete
MPQKPYRHRVEKTRNKHSRAVFREETIVIKLARNLSKNEQKEHVQDLLGRMTKQLLKEEKHRIHIHPFKALLSGQEQDSITLANGRTYEISLRPGEKLAAKPTAKGWEITVSASVRRETLHRFLWKLIADAEYEEMTNYVETVNRETLQVSVKKLRLRFASSQWGSCSPREIIMLNAALLFVPPHLLRYVTIHELAHRLNAGHSPAYWKILQSAIPDYREVRAELHTYRLPQL